MRPQTIEELKEVTKKINILEKAGEELHNRKDRSAWNRGVTDFATDFIGYLIDNIEDFKGDLFKSADVYKFMLNGARDWSEYSWSGYALIYNSDIAAALCTPSELKKTKNGERRPNSQEEWLDVQARALCQAARRAYNAIRRNNGEI